MGSGDRPGSRELPAVDGGAARPGGGGTADGDGTGTAQAPPHATTDRTPANHTGRTPVDGTDRGARLSGGRTTPLGGSLSPDRVGWWADAASGVQGTEPPGRQRQRGPAVNRRRIEGLLLGLAAGDAAGWPAA